MRHLETTIRLEGIVAAWGIGPRARTHGYNFLETRGSGGAAQRGV